VSADTSRQSNGIGALILFVAGLAGAAQAQDIFTPIEFRHSTTRITAEMHCSDGEQTYVLTGDGAFEYTENVEGKPESFHAIVGPLEFNQAVDELLASGFLSHPARVKNYMYSTREGVARISEPDVVSGCSLIVDLAGASSIKRVEYEHSRLWPSLVMERFTRLAFPRRD
jgi:hypothetical protein